MPEFGNNQQIVMAARKNMSDAAWDYLAGGSESETTLRRNRIAFERWAVLPRILRDVSKIDPSTTLFDIPMRIPVLLAPIGSIEMFDPEGGAPAAGKAAEEYGTIQAVSMHTQPSTDAMAAGSGGPKIFQLYPQGDVAWAREKLDGAKAAGYLALAVTAEVPVNARRERGMGAPRPQAQNRTTGRDMGDRVARAAMNWDMLDRMREIWGDRSFMLKGVATPADARLAVEHGVDAIWISNHGGRQIDHGLGTLDSLPQIAEAVNGKAKIVLDGGVQRGNDVMKALALGADVVAIGKMQGFGLGAAGQAGLVRLLEIMEAEIRVAMGLLGVNKVSELDESYVTKVDPVIPVNDLTVFASTPLE